jgi:hypothetical protein
MAKQRNQAGGGPGSRVVQEVGVRNGMPARVMSPRGVSQIGSSMGNHTTGNSGRTRSPIEPVRGANLPAGLSVPLGNALATNVAGGGPGKGRNLWGQSGSQKQWGPSAPGAGRIADTRGEWPDTNTKR